MKVGEYIRTINGYIRKIISIKAGKDKTYYGEFILDKPYKNSYSVSRKKIKAHSKNIIDLIEVGDIIEYDIDGFTHKADVFQSTYYNLAIATVNNSIIDLEERPNIIKTIVTKEQFEQNSYKIGE